MEVEASLTGRQAPYRTSRHAIGVPEALPDENLVLNSRIPTYRNKVSPNMSNTIRTAFTHEATSPLERCTEMLHRGTAHQL